MINLGDKKWGVKDSGLLAYKQVGSRFFNKDFDFSRASNGTYVGKDGLLKTAELYNLLQYSNRFDTWTFDDVTRTGGQIGYDGFDNAWLIQYNTTASRHNINKVVSFSGSGTFSIYAKAKELQYIQIASAQTTDEYANFDLSDGSVGNVGSRFTNVQANPIGNDWYRLSVTTANGYNSMYISIVTSKTAGWLESFSGTNSTDGLYIQDAQLVEGTEPLDYQYTNGLQGIPRIDYTDGVGALLLEPQRTNYASYSEYFDSWWNKTNSLISHNSNLSPNGLNNAAKLIPNNSATKSRIWKGPYGSGSQVVSVFAKAAEYDSLYLSGYDGSAYKYAAYNLSNGTLISANADNYEIEDYGKGWYRIWVYVSSSTARYANLSIGNSTDTIDGTGFSINANGTDGLYIYGYQIELDESYPTSYIKTEGSAVTRLADVANNCGSEQDFNSEEGVLFIEASALSEGGNNRNLYITGSTFDNYVGFRYSNDANRFRAFIRGGGAALDSLSTFGMVQTNNNKIALVYKTSEFSMWVNGSKVSTASPTAMPIGLNTLAFDWVGSGNFYGKVKSLKYFPEALGDTVLTTLTGGDGSLNGLFTAYKSRVEADGGYLEAETCLINKLKELL